jgi:4-oxalocrotonate tautomerase
MPHIVVKMHSGRSEALKKDLTDRIAEAVRTSLTLDDSTVSVAIEEFAPEEWLEKVYLPDIVARPGQIWKKPGYDPRTKS